MTSNKQFRHSRHFESLEPRCLLALDTVAGTGITAQYFSDTEVQSVFVTRLETSLTQNWGSGSPALGLNVDQFSGRFIGQLEATFTEPHSFTLSAEGGARLWINGRKVIDRWSDSSVINATTTVELVSGRKYDIQLEFKESSGSASIDLKWSSPSLPIQALPTARLFPSERGSIERRNWSSLAGSSVSALTSLVTYPNNPTSITSLTSLEVTSSGGDQYGDLLIGELHPTTTGLHRFYIAADDSAELWLSNSADPAGKQRIALVSSPTAEQDWTATPGQQSELIPLVAGQAYAFEVIHKENSGADHLAVGWQQPGSSSISVIDGQYLSPSLPTVRAFSQKVVATEGQATPLSFTVVREGGPTTNPLVVNYALLGTAIAGQDYTSVLGTVTIPAGAASSSVLITTLSDVLIEGPETVIFEIVDGPGYQVGLISERRSLATIQDVRSAPSGGTQITPVSTLANSSRFGGTFQAVTVSPYTNVIQAAITSQPANTFNAQLKFNYNASIQAGDLLWADFYVRAIGSDGKITVVSEITSSPFTKSVERSYTIPTDWTRIQVPFASVSATAANAATFGFFLGSKIQTLQFADVSVRNYGPSRDITPTSYFLNNIGGTFGNSSAVTVTGQPFESAVRINTVTTPDQTFKLQYVGRNSQRVATASNIRLEYYARSISGVNPRIATVIQQASGAFTTLASIQHSVTSTWTKYTLDATTTAAFGVDGLQAAFNVGFTPQSTEIADIKWTNLSATTSLSDLPSIGTATSYAGRSGDDSWRNSADTRIDDIRKAMLTVNVVDAQGNPINGAVVSIQQDRHAFRFGSAIDGNNGLLSSTGGPTATKYQSEIKRLFNAATIENSMKWPPSLANAQNGIDAANWVVDNNMLLRGHNIVWPSRRNMPTSVWTQYDSIKNAQGDLAAASYLRTTLEARIQTAVTTFQGLVSEWDVVNEPFDNNDVMAILGDSAVNDWFAQVRTLSPNIERVLNDYDIFARNGNNTAHRSSFDYWLGRLKSNDGNNSNDFIERIGEQSHYNEGNLTDIAVLGQLLQLYNTQFALPIGITEFDVNTSDRQLQADYLRDYLTMSFSQSGVDEFIQWGFWSGLHWLPDAALYDIDFSIRPNGQVYEDLVFGNWWTDTRATTRNGAVSSEVFKGDYQITVTFGSQTTTKLLTTFNADGATTIEIPGVVWSQTQLSGSEGTTSSLTATLSQAPTADVVLNLTSTSQVEVSPSQVTFTTANWNIPRTIVLSPIEDFTIEGVQTASFQASVSSADLQFNASKVNPISIQFADGKSQLPIVTSANFNIPENSANGTIVGTVIATDPDVGQTLTLSIVSGNTNGAFAIHPTSGQVTVANSGAIDFESSPIFNLVVQATDSWTPTASSTGLIQINLSNVNEAIATIVNRRLFYNNAAGANLSSLGNANSSIASDKNALRPGETSGYVNYTNYSRGLNGLIIDINNLSATTTNNQILASLQFARWNGIDAVGFAALPVNAVPTATVLPASGLGGSARVKITFPDNTLQNTWLRVTVVANGQTGLSADDVFYFGNVIGELNTGNSATRLRVNATDTGAVRSNQSTASNSASVTNIYDVNRDGRVNATDTEIVRSNQQTIGIVAPITIPLPLFASVASLASDQFILAPSIIIASVNGTTGNGSSKEMTPVNRNDYVSAFDKPTLKLLEVSPQIISRTSRLESEGILLEDPRPETAKSASISAELKMIDRYFALL